jgi:hypothetical protein
VVAVITVVIAVAGIAFIVVVAIVVGIVDAVRAPRWRQIAAERHENWEARQFQHHGPPQREPWDD